MPKIVTTDQMRAIEQAADAKNHSYAAMMALAGRAVADRIKEIIQFVPEPRVAILVGPGNNGGDGLVAGRLLQEELEAATVGAFLLKPRDEDDEVFTQARDAGVFIADAENDAPAGFRALQNLVGNADVVVDALFGTAVRLPIEGDAAKALKAVHKALTVRRAETPRASFTTPADPAIHDGHNAPVIIAVDCPSGLHCDTGELDKNALHADETITFAAAKPGLLMAPGAEAIGRLHVADIGLPQNLPELGNITLTLVDAAETAARLPKRPMDSHKGTFGKTMVVAGSLNYIGAPFLAANAAYRVGAGLVTVGAPQIIIPTLAGMLPEATWLLLPHDMGVLNEAAVRVLREELNGYAALLIGPGMGHEDVTGEFLRELLGPAEENQRKRAIGFVPAEPSSAANETRPALPPLVIDADGLNLLAAQENWPAMLPSNTILTPHPGEFARLAGIGRDEVVANRTRLAQEKAAAWNCTVVLKGAYTVIAAPDGQTALLPFATSALASAGTGDVLAGAITGLLAQGLTPFDAALAGGWLHGMAGIRAADLLETEASVMAGDVLELLADAYALAEQAR